MIKRQKTSERQIEAEGFYHGSQGINPEEIINNADQSVRKLDELLLRYI